ncbi:uncharacterized protein BP01DRAFT_383066 [Aspergillus saccharolyticus JOP 1030-1]|uniref:Uncharacterized protein n=1 Tax=Aspergillus saccharolyticus JOP 1030-1 TaxID=1450539 RepID=A0A318ZBN0_9EURO|nr:hypothetical protein BP01DRAFT_383066 [Aspergillus saccharolyticus JOP 1030-1]PYH44835.1 hypothetical protein BP01DRAFT_383066 [Aspergillus saccharolyticus JOP 1030-1]
MATSDTIALPDGFSCKTVKFTKEQLQSLPNDYYTCVGDQVFLCPWKVECRYLVPATCTIKLTWSSGADLGDPDDVADWEIRGPFALAKAIGQRRARFPTCKRMLGYIVRNDYVQVFFEKPQILNDGAVVLKKVEFDGRSTFHGHNDKETVLKPLNRVVPRNKYDPKEAEWCRACLRQKGTPVEGFGFTALLPVVEQTGFEDCISANACLICGREHEPYNVNRKTLTA